MISVEIINVVLSDKGFVVLLKSKEDKRVLPIFIGENEARSIIIALSNTQPSRPLTHDLLKNVLDELLYKPVKIIVSDLIDDTYYGEIVLEKDGLQITVDSRPSDAIALAVRSKTPIYVAEKVFDEAGVLIQEETEQKPQEPQKDVSRPTGLSALESLKRKLQEAIQNEEYEKAADLRDQMKKFTSSN